MKPTRIILSTLFLLTLLTMAQSRPAEAAPNYYYYLTGNGNDVTPPTNGGLMLMGGGTDVDAAFQWFINQSGGGDIVVIRVTGSDGYNPYIYSLGSLDSVETLVIRNRTGANDPFVVNKIRNAEALFIAGGDQKDYIKLWKGTQTEDAIHYLLTRNVPIGGTSAGLAVLGEFSFSALYGTVYSNEALANPYNRYMTLERDFLHIPQLAGIVTDSHFAERDRMGRAIAFLARIIKDGWASEAKGIAVDEQTALVVDSNGQATLMGSGHAYMLRTPGPPQVCQGRSPLTFLNISVYRLAAGNTFDLNSWTGNGGLAYTVSAQTGVLSSTQPGGGIY